MWILIIMLLTDDFRGGAAITTQEFTSYEKCKIASDKLIEIKNQNQYRGSGKYLIVPCVEK